MDQPFNLVLLAVVGLFIWLALRPNYVFLIRIDQGAARLAKGKVAQPFLHEVIDICGRDGVTRGWIGGIGRGRRHKLVFSRSIPASCRQKLLNVWALPR